jgi:ankyrin repeat protein
LGISYYNNNEQIINYLTKERNVQFTKNIYNISLKWAIGGNELNRVKEISKNINLKEDYNGDFWYSSYEIIDFLVSQGLDINKNDKNTINSLIWCNELDKIKFLKNKGLNLVFDSATKKHFLELATKEGYFDFYDWLKENIRIKSSNN